MRLNEKIHIVEYNSCWDRDYEYEVDELKKKTSLSELAYEHVGSTSIPGMKAKPIIDIIIGVKIFPPGKDIINDIEASGYTYMEEMSVTDRLYCIKRGIRNFNIHIISYKGNIWNNDILFREYLTSHPFEAEKYSLLKEKIISTGVDDLLEYSRLKSNFISEIYEMMNKK